MDNQSEVKVKEKTKEKNRIRKRYNCVYINDDKTSFEFVIDSLISVFKRTEEDALQITLQVHNNGKGIGNSHPLSKDIACTKQQEVIKIAREQGFPLQIIIEEVK